jgi:hypothetical protein
VRIPLRTVVLALLTVATVGGPSVASAAITIAGFAFGSEGPEIVGATIENFEDVNLVPGLRIRMGGVPGGHPNRNWEGTIPRTWNPSTVTSCCLIGGPFPANTWDGTFALCNGGLGGAGNTGVSPGTGNYFDFVFADSVYFVFSTPMSKVGIGLSNFQSLGGPIPVTQHELIVNGVSRGLLETLLPGWAPGPNFRNRYLVITATAPDAIQSVTVQNVSAVDGLVFDKIAFQDFTSPATTTSWGRIKAIYRP